MRAHLSGIVAASSTSCIADRANGLIKSRNLKRLSGEWLHFIYSDKAKFRLIEQYSWKAGFVEVAVRL